jgi:hypothetical protein
MAVFAALCAFIHLLEGFTNHQLRSQVARLLGIDPEKYTRARMTYDLRRLRLKGLIARIARTRRYRLTRHGLQVALFFTKTYARIIRPGQAVLDSPASAEVPRPLARAWNRFSQDLDQIVQLTHLAG